MFLAGVSLCLLYAVSIYYFPEVGKNLDDGLWVTFHADLSKKIELMFDASNNARNTFNEKLDNPAPNTSKKLEERSARQ